jgi:enoyl-[acyl-carrier protein] reductase I
MGFLAGKRLLITGVLSNRSIAYGIARACHREGAELAFSYVGERFKDRITEFAREFGSNWSFDCDVGDDAQIDRCSPSSARPGPSSTASCMPSPSHPREAIAGDFLDGLSARTSASPTTSPPTASRPWPRPPCPVCARRRLLTLSYLGAMRCAQLQHHGPGQGLAGSQRALPGPEPGPRGVRVNGISAGPIKTLAASGIKDFGKLLAEFSAPRRSAGDHHRRRRQHGGLPAVGPGRGISAEIVYVDGGFSHVAIGNPEATG